MIFYYEEKRQLFFAEKSNITLQDGGRILASEERAEIGVRGNHGKKKRERYLNWQVFW